jgi:hypothetical protein
MQWPRGIKTPRAEKKTEVLYFEPFDSLSVFEMHARFLGMKKE